MEEMLSHEMDITMEGSAPVFETLFTLVKDLEYPAGRSGVRGTVSEVIANSTTTEVPKCLQIGLGLSEEPENSTMQQGIMNFEHQIVLGAWDAQRVPPGRANTATVCEDLDEVRGRSCVRVRARARMCVN